MGACETVLLGGLSALKSQSAEMKQTHVHRRGE